MQGKIAVRNLEKNNYLEKLSISKSTNLVRGGCGPNELRWRMEQFESRFV